MADVNRLLDQLDKVKKTGTDRYIARCPAHADKSPSLTIRFNDDKILLHCFGGCAVDAVVSAIGLTLSDLMPDRVNFEGTKPIKSKIPASDLLAFIHFEATIVMLSAGDMIAGNTLSDTSFLRLRLAHERLEGAVQECCR